MKKIAYIELDTHAEIATNFMELIQDSNKFEVDFYCSPKILKLTGKPQIGNVILSDSSTILEQLSGAKYDLIIIGTLHRYFNVFQRIVDQNNTAIILHNTNFPKAGKFQLLKSILKTDRLYRLKLLAKEGLLSASKVFRNAAHLLVLDQSLENENHIFFPVFFNQSNEENQDEIFNIVIPGAVSQRRRDYNHIFETIKKIKPENQLQFVFLGKASGKELEKLEKLKKNNRQNIEIQFFKEKVPQNIFDDWIKRADVLWCPIQEKTQFFGIEEIYGKTKMTGNLGDAIKFGKLAVFPENYRSKYPFIINENSNFLEQAQNISKLKFDFQNDFSQEKVLEKLEKALKNMIK